MEPRFYKLPTSVGDVTLRVAKGHFATRNSHTNYFVDVTRQQSCIRDAEAVAQRHGIEASLSSQVNADGYDSSLTLRTDSTSIACTLYGTDRPARIISLFGYSFDIEPASQSLVLRYIDAPGRIGVVGTILGQAGVNITTMQIGTRPDSDSAVVILNVEGDVTDEVLDDLRQGIDGLQDLWRITL